ncbi:MAG: hypothetical protein IPI10_08910 [Bacteroidetes bacterium]|nr:hypothetical protein [Bacteroidota bacterium]
MHYSSKEIIEYSNQHSAGTRMPRVSWQSLKEFEIMIPDDKTIIEFEKITFPILKSIIQRIHENKTLTQLRDILLPKLMSGEVNVEQITAVA